MPHAPLGVLNITFVSGDEVNMDMEDTLSSRRPYVNSDVITVRLELLIQPRAFNGNQLHASVDFFRGQVEKAGDMTARDDQSMSRTHRVAVTGAVRKLML